MTLPTPEEQEDFDADAHVVLGTLSDCKDPNAELAIIAMGAAEFLASFGPTERKSARLDPAVLVGVRIPANEPRVAMSIQVAGGKTVTAALNGKSLRKVIAAVTEADDPNGFAVVVQGKLEGDNLLEAGITAIAKTPKPVAEAA
jgi:hypothetical protein